jgi:putative membrane protein
MMDYGYGHPGTHWGALIVGIAFMLVVAGGLAWILVTLLRQSRPPTPAPPSPGPPGGSDALRILEERFARGEIDAEEYRSRRDLLVRRE